MKASRLEFDSFADLLNHEKEALLKECDLCGRCMEMCQALPHLELSNKNPIKLQEVLLGVLRGSQASPEAYTRAFACALCASCLHSCPKSLNPYHAQCIARATMIADGQGPEAPLESRGIDNTGYDLRDVLCGLQLKSSDIRWLRRVPNNPQQKDIVLFLGCAVREMPDKILATLDILGKLDLDYVALAGEPACCGNKYLVSGNFNKAESSLHELVSALDVFRPKKVVFWCGSCYHMFKHEVPRFASLPFDVQYLSQFLCDNLSEFEFVAPLDKTVTVHDSCNLGRKGGDYSSVRNLLSAIPGLDLVEMPHNRESALCCGGAAHRYYPEIANLMRRKRLEEARSTGADVLVASCVGCHLFFSHDEKDYPFEVKNYVTVLAEALGINYEDKLKKFLKLKSVDRVLNEAREYIDTSPLGLEQTRRIVSGFFEKQGLSRPWW